MIEDMWEKMVQMQREMDHLFTERWGGLHERPLPVPKAAKQELAHWGPATTDLQETDKEVIAAFDIPGVEKKDIELHVNEQSISVKAERKEEVKEEKKGVYRHERSYAGFFRQLALPAKVLPKNANAEYKDGVLKVIMPKAEPRKLEKRIKLEIR